jgi:two-component system OmpR family response regulator
LRKDKIVKFAKKPLVLLIDPDEMFGQEVARNLSQRFQLLFAKTLEEGSILFSRYRPSVVLMEINQLDGDGLKWIKTARSYKWANGIAIACVTTSRGVSDKINGFKAGADDYLVKPLDMQMILARVILLIRSRKMGF